MSVEMCRAYPPDDGDELLDERLLRGHFREPAVGWEGGEEGGGGRGGNNNTGDVQFLRGEKGYEEEKRWELGGVRRKCG